MTNERAIQVLEDLSIGLDMTAEDHEAVQLGISAIQDWIDHLTEPPKNTIPARIVFVVDAENCIRAQLIGYAPWETEKKALDMLMNAYDWSNPTISGIILAHLPRSQSVEVQGTVEVKEET